MTDELVPTTSPPPPMTPAAQLPPMNIATLELQQLSSDTLDRYRDEQKLCDDQLRYWSSRHADVSRAIEGLMAMYQGMNRVTPRVTKVVTGRKPKAKPNA